MFVSRATSVRWSSDLTPSQMRYMSAPVSEKTCLYNSGKPWAQTFFIHPRRVPTVAAQSDHFKRWFPGYFSFCIVLQETGHLLANIWARICVCCIFQSENCHRIKLQF